MKPRTVLDLLFTPDDLYEERACDVLGKVLNVKPRQDRVPRETICEGVVACILPVRNAKTNQGVGNGETRDFHTGHAIGNDRRLEYQNP